MTDFNTGLEQLRLDIVAQSDRVFEQLQGAVDCAFDGDTQAADVVLAADREIDSIDVEIEKSAVKLLTLDVTDPDSIRAVLAIVKINNELERIGDCAVNIADIVSTSGEDLDEKPPATFRVMANSVIGMVREAKRSLETQQTDIAREVLGFDETVANFKREISLDAENQVAAGEFSVRFAFRLRTIVANLERIADHCTNICEQIIYQRSGKVFVHRSGRWSEPNQQNT